jgi:hypothetical protein
MCLFWNLTRKMRRMREMNLSTTSPITRPPYH